MVLARVNGRAGETKGTKFKEGDYTNTSTPLKSRRDSISVGHKIEHCPSPVGTKYYLATSSRSTNCYKYNTVYKNI